MVRSSASGHTRKRSRSRSITPDHKRSKSSRDYDKDRLRRRSRSRDRIRRSRSRDRKKEKRDTESRIRSKPLKFDRRSRLRSTSRSKSKEKIVKKDEKKDTKAEDEPFDPTNLDKVPGDEEEWVVTDTIEDPVTEDNGNLEEEYDYEADEDDQYPHHNNSSSHNSNHSSPERSENKASKEALAVNENGKEDNACTENNKTLTVETQIEKLSQEKGKQKEKITYLVSKLNEKTLNIRESILNVSSRQERNKTRPRSHSSGRSKRSSRRPTSDDVLKLQQEHLRQCMKLDKNLHELRVKHENERHRAELEVISAQLDYWKKK